MGLNLDKSASETAPAERIGAPEIEVTAEMVDAAAEELSGSILDLVDGYQASSDVARRALLAALRVKAKAS